LKSLGLASTRPVNSEIPVTGLASGQGRHPHALAMPSMRPICRVLNSGLNRNRPHVPRRATPLWGKSGSRRHPAVSTVWRAQRAVHFDQPEATRGWFDPGRSRTTARAAVSRSGNTRPSHGCDRARGSADGELQRQGEHDSNVEPMSLTDLLPESATADIVDAIRAAADTGHLSSSRSTSSPKTR